MVIRSSSLREVEQLLTELREGGTTRRETAVARLRLLGARADERLASFIASDALPDARTAALRALDGRDDARARQVASAACADADPSVAIAAVTLLRGWIAGEPGTEALDTLVGIAVDPAREAAVRQRALDALSELPPDIVGPLLRNLPGSLNQEPEATRTLEAIDDPLAMSAWLGEHRDAPLSSLHEAVTRIRQRESEDLPAQVRDAWTAARGAAHAALAARASRVALYDLKESFDSASKSLPRDFLTAMTALGDASCLEPLARAWTAASGDDWWRERLREAATQMMKREALTTRHTVVRRVRAKYTGFL